jgi:hypothetical protein
MFRRFTMYLALVLSSLLLVACGGASRSENEIYAATVESVREEAPLKEKFSNVLISEISAAKEVATDYPTITEDFKRSFLGALESKNTAAKKYKKASMKDASPVPASTILVAIDIPEMRIVGTGARVFLGSMTGNSYMNVHVRLTDGASGRLLLDKIVNTTVSGFAANYSFGANDRSLVSDTGDIVAEYLFTVIPGE